MGQTRRITSDEQPMELRLRQSVSRKSNEYFHCIPSRREYRSMNICSLRTFFHADLISMRQVSYEKKGEYLSSSGDVDFLVISIPKVNFVELSFYE